MLLAGRDADYGERGLEEEAETLAKNINRRLTNQLARDPKVTAMALAKYDATLPGQLMAVWGGEGWINGKSSEVRQRSEQETRRLIRTWREMADTAEAQMAEAAQAHPEKISVLHDAQGLVILDGDQEIQF
jgi:uncharacterized protein YecA (UPF0149 family)